MERDDMKIYDDVLLSRSALQRRFEKQQRNTALTREGSHDDHGNDGVDGANRQVGEVTPTKASICDYLFALGSSCTFFADIVTDALVAYQHYGNGDYEWFGLTLAFIIIPSFVMQIFSCRWFREDYLSQKWWTYVLHFFQLGTIERYFIAFRYGFKTRKQEKVNKEDYTRFLKEWRDITLLRLFEGFLEAAPQTILQLYILASHSEFIVSRDWLTALSAVVSVISLSWSIVSYSQMLRLCLSDKGLSYCGYIFQIIYRLFMVSSRVVVLVLFAVAYKEYVFIFIFVHCCVMFAWINFQDTVERLENRVQNQNGDSNRSIIMDKLFDVIVSVIYLYCFMTIQGKTTRRVISIFYTVMFVESAVLMAAWFPRRTLHGALMYACFGVVFGGFLFGIICMMMYYKFFHPTHDITEGWFTCLCLGEKERPELKDSILKKTSFSYTSEDKDLVIINIKDKKYHQLDESADDHSPVTRKSLKKPPTEAVELVRPSSPLKYVKKTVSCSDERTASGVNLSGSPSKGERKSTTLPGYFKYGACQSPEKRLGNGGHAGVAGNGKSAPEISSKVRQQSTENRGNASQLRIGNMLVSVSKTKDMKQWNKDSDLMKNKSELCDMKMRNEGFTTGPKIDKNGNCEKLDEKKPLIERQGSKDDSVLLSKNSGSLGKMKKRRNSLPEKDFIRQNLYAWVKEQLLENKQQNNRADLNSGPSTQENDVLSTLV